MEDDPGDAGEDDVGRRAGEATRTDWLRGWRSRLIETGTGFAQPNIGVAEQSEDDGHDDRAEGVDVLDRVEGEPAGAFRRCRRRTRGRRRRGSPRGRITAGMKTGGRSAVSLVDHVVADR